MNPTKHHRKTISYRDQIINRSLEEYFGEEEADTYIDGKEEEEYLGDYDFNKYQEDE